MMHIEEAIKAAQRRDPRPFIENFIGIPTKQNQILPFTLNRLQAHIHKNETGRDYWLKYRQGGSSVYQIARNLVYCIAVPNFTAAGITISTDNGRQKKILFNHIDTFLEYMRPEAKPTIVRYDQNGYIEFKNGSVFFFTTVGSGEVGRGVTINSLWVTELGSFTPKEAEAALTSSLESVVPGGLITFETTPKLIGSPAHQFYLECKGEKKPYKAHFTPWWFADDYHIPPNHIDALPSDRGAIMLTEEERRLAERFFDDGIPVEDRIRWRRAKIADREGNFFAEYPEDEASCWLSATTSVFPIERLRPMFSEVLHPEENPVGVRVYVGGAPERQYVCGVDGAGGIPGQDYSAAVVQDVSTGRVVATIHGYFSPPEMARKVAELGIRYNRFMVGGERDAWTSQVMDELRRMGWTEFYYHDDGGKTIDIGFPNTNTSRLQSVARLRDAIWQRDFSTQDEDLLLELVQYTRITNERGLERYGAPEGLHDDLCVAAQRAQQMRSTVPGGGAFVAPRQEDLVSVYPGTGW